jgi:hypothetical protein
MIVDTEALRAKIFSLEPSTDAERAATIEFVAAVETLAAEYTEQELTRARGGTAERQIPINRVEIPDLWHIALELPGEIDDANTPRGAVLEVWHLCHDLLSHIKGE